MGLKSEGHITEVAIVASIMTSSVICKREFLSYPSLDELFAIGLEL